MQNPLILFNSIAHFQEYEQKNMCRIYKYMQYFYFPGTYTPSGPTQ